MEWSIVISAGALVVSALSYRHSRQTAISQHAPYLRAWFTEKPEKLSIWIENKGNGPAIVKKLHIHEPGSTDERLRNALWYYRQKGLRSCAEQVRPGYAIGVKDDPIELLALDVTGMDFIDRNHALNSIGALKLTLQYSTMRNSTHIFKWSIES